MTADVFDSAVASSSASAAAPTGNRDVEMAAEVFDSAAVSSSGPAPPTPHLVPGSIRAPATR
eukprot:6800282-Prorocentrum_lima.AAC.1